MKMNGFRSLTSAGVALVAIALSTPTLAHDGRWHGHPGRAHFGFPGHRVVVVRPAVIAPRPVVVYRPAPVYYAPAPVYYYSSGPAYYASTANIVGGALAGAVIGGALGDGRPGAIAVGSVIGAAVGGSIR